MERLPKEIQALIDGVENPALKFEIIETYEKIKAQREKADKFRVGYDTWQEIFRGLTLACNTLDRKSAEYEQFSMLQLLIAQQVGLEPGNEARYKEIFPWVRAK